MPVHAAASPEWITAIFAVVAGVASGVWALQRWLTERSDARTQATALARERLKQERDAEHHRREDRAAELVVKLGETDSPEARRWIAGALALYPEQSTRLLVNSLGHAGDAETASALTMALALIGRPAMADVLHAHRLARRVVAIEAAEEGDAAAAADLLGAAETLRCTRRLIAHLVIDAREDERAAMDLAGVDLSAINLADMALPRINLRKAVLDTAVLARANLKHANFRGANAAGAIFTRANAEHADFTGLIGPIRGIRLTADHATFQDAKLGDSQLDAARFRHGSFLRTDLVHASAPGAVFDHATIRRCHWQGIELRKAVAHDTTFNGVKLGGAVLEDANFSGSRLQGCRLTGVAAARFELVEGTVSDCDFGGAHLSGANLRRAVFSRCNFSGADLARANLCDARFVDCAFNRTVFRETRLTGTRFDGARETRPRGLVVEGNWRDAVFEHPALREAFEAAAG